MKIQMGMKFRIYLNQTEKARLAVQFGHARFVYNSTLAARKEHFELRVLAGFKIPFIAKEHRNWLTEHVRKWDTLTGKGLSKAACDKRITAFKKDENFSWLRDADSQALQQKSAAVDTAYKNFFKHIAGYPSFKQLPQELRDFKLVEKM